MAVEQRIVIPRADACTQSVTCLGRLSRVEKFFSPLILSGRTTATLQFVQHFCWLYPFHILRSISGTERVTGVTEGSYGITTGIGSRRAPFPFSAHFVFSDILDLFSFSPGFVAPIVCMFACFLFVNISFYS
jgi:hypothetical protein